MRFMALAVGGDEDWSCLAPDEIQIRVQRYTDWAERTARSGHLIAGGSLDNDVRALDKTGSAAVTTQVRGWTEVEAASLDEAAALFSDHPHLDFGVVEIRPVTDLG